MSKGNINDFSGLTAIMKEISNKMDKFDDLNNTMNDLNNTMNNKFNKMLNKLDKLDELNNTMNNKFDDLNNTMNDLNNTMNNKFDELNNTMNNKFDDLNNTMNNKFDELNNTMNEMSLSLILSGMDRSGENDFTDFARQGGVGPEIEESFSMENSMDSSDLDELPDEVYRYEDY